MLLWSLTREDGQYGYPKRSLKGHSHFVQDVVISSDGQFALTGSWDHTLRLWDLHTGQTTRRFIGHTKDVLSVAFSMDNRQACASSYRPSRMLAALWAPCSSHLLILQVLTGRAMVAHRLFGVEQQGVSHRDWPVVSLSSCDLHIGAAGSRVLWVMRADRVWRPGQDDQAVEHDR